MIVGLAIVMGIRAFRENATRANADVLVQDVIEIAEDAITWKLSPAQFGGQENGKCKADPACFQGLNFHKLGYGEKGNPFRYEGPDGTFRLVERKDALGIKACNTRNGNKFIVEFRGVNPDSIVLVSSAIGTDYGCTD